MSLPNIVILILDTVRARNMSCYGYSKHTTPHMDKFAAKYALFKRAYTTSTWTIPTHASLLSGLYLSQHRIENILANRRFHPEIVSLPQAMKRVGYNTVGFSQNVLFSPQHHFNGFDEFYLHDEIIQKHPIGKWLGKRPDHAGKLKAQLTRYLRKTLNLDWFLESMQQWMVQPRNKPFFMVSNITHVHSPWAPALDVLLRQLGGNVRALRKNEMIAPKAFEFNSGKRSITSKHKQIWEQLYDAALIQTDRALGKFFHKISNWQGWENTIFAITADHGEVLGDYRNLFGHTLTLSDRVMHIPLLLKHPDYSKGTQVEGVVQLHDLFSTIIEWCNIPNIPQAQLQRPSLTHSLRAPSALTGIAFAEEDFTDSYDVIQGLKSVNPKMPGDRYPRRQVAVHAGTHKLIWHDDRPPELFHIERDPGENNNLAEPNGTENQKKFYELKEALEKWQASLEIFPPRKLRETKEFDSNMVDRLKALGYVT